MSHYEYKVVPAPRRGLKARGVKGAEARFAYAIQTLMNDMAGQGWEFLRAEALPSEERHGLTSAQTIYRDLLVFRRDRAVAQAPVNDPVPDWHATDDTTADHADAPEDLPDEPIEPEASEPEAEELPATIETARRD